MIITCRSCVLRPLVASDAESLTRHANDPAVAGNLRDRFPHPYARADAEAYIAQVSRRPVPLSFGIAVDDEVIGTIGLVPGEDVERVSAEVGYWIGQTFWGRGIAADALAAVTRHAFDTLDFVRVFAVPFASSVQSVRVLEKAGYVREGFMRRSAIKHGTLLDQWLFATYADGDPIASR